jgi:hypothetical protein
MLKFIHLLNNFAMSYIRHMQVIPKFFLSFQLIFNIISNIKYIKNSKIYSLIKLLFKLFIYFNLFMLTTDFINIITYCSSILPSYFTFIYYSIIFMILSILIHYSTGWIRVIVNGVK